MKKCHNCGKLNADESTRCFYCSAELPDSYADTSNQPNSYANTANQQNASQSAPYEQYVYPSFDYNSYYSRNNAFDGDAKGKSRGIAAILAILIGGLGVHYFYMGKIVGGFICILLTLCTCGIWELITFIQGIVLFCLSNYEFDRKYIYSNSKFPVF